MKSDIKYIEQATGFNHDGPAWIAHVQLSKTGKTIYFNGMSLASCKGSGIGANFYDVDTGDEYWVSGVKKESTNRHWAGGGKIKVEESAVEWLENHIKFPLNRYFEVIPDLPKTDISKQNELANPRD